MRKPRYLLSGRYGRLDCDQPLRVDLSCGALEYWACSNHRASKCVPCSWRYRRLLTRIAETGCRDDSAGHVYLLTLTAPGDREHYRRSGEVCPCTPAGGVDLGLWNASAARKWNRLRTRLKRLHPDLRFLRAVEVQTRGALHLHILVRSSQRLDVEALRALAIGYGFGHSVDLAAVEPGSRKAAYYVAKYVTKACDTRDSVPWIAQVADAVTGELRAMQTNATYRTWSSSRDWGLTMKQLRASNRAHVLRAAELAAARPETLTRQAIPAATVQAPDPPSPD